MSVAIAAGLQGAHVLEALQTMLSVRRGARPWLSAALRRRVATKGWTLRHFAGKPSEDDDRDAGAKPRPIIVRLGAV